MFRKVRLYIPVLIFLLIEQWISAQIYDGNRNCSVCSEFKDSRQQINKSIIPVWFDGVNDYLKYDVDLVIQDMDIYNEQDIIKWKNIVDEIHKQGKLFYSELRALTQLGKIFEYNMEDPGMQQALTLDLNLNSIKTPWMSNRGFKDTPVRFFCGNNPRFRAFLRQQVYIMSQVGVDGIMVDDYTGTPGTYEIGGCFCDYCMAGFRNYLKNKYNDEELKKLGIEEINSFNYRYEVLKYADDVQSLKMARNLGEVPLDEDFRYFLFKSDADLFASLKEMACRLSGRYIEMGWDNVDFRNDRAIYYDFIDSYYTECTYLRPWMLTLENKSKNKNEKQSGNTLFYPEMIVLNKFSDATHKWFTPTPEPNAWGTVKINQISGILNLWIAFNYANGANFRYPRKGWCYGNTSRWYYPEKKEIEPVYSFIRDNRELFDNYEAVEQIGVLYTHIGKGNLLSGEYYKPLRYVCGQLVNSNIPFGTPVAGDNWLVNRIVEEDIDRFEVMLIPEPYKISKEQQQVIDTWKIKKPVIHVKEGDDPEPLLKGKIKPLLSLDSKNKVWLFPRHNILDEKAPLICHVLNHDFNAAINKNNLQKNICISLSQRLMGESEIKSVYYYTIGSEPIKMNYKIEADNIYIEIPELELWGVIKVEKQQTSQFINR